MKLNAIVTAAVLLGSSALAPFAAEEIIYDGGTAESIAFPTNGPTLFVGKNNDNNTLTVDNGGIVTVDTAQIGQFSDNNELLVSGTNASVLVGEELVVGEVGHNNSLVAENGGWISVGSAFSTNGAGISVGNTNGTARLAIGNGSTVETEFFHQGVVSNETGSVELAGSGSQMTVSDTAYIGLEGSDNLFSIENGASLVVSNLLQVGSATSTNNNLNVERNGKAIIVGSVVINNPGENSIHVKNGGQLTYTGNADIEAAGAAGFDFDSGATLEIGGALTYGKMNDGFTIILDDSLNTTLTSKWDTAGSDLYVGQDVGANKLLLRNGAQASTSKDAYIGETSSGNEIKVSGTNSTLAVGNDLFVGLAGRQNKLTLADGGKASIDGSLRIGRRDTSDKNEVSVSGTNTSLEVVDLIILGEGSNENSLTLSDAAQASASGLLVGLNNDKNAFNIESGAQMVIAGDALVGTNGANNTIKVTGTNSLLDVAGFLTLGNMAETNSNTGNTLSAFETGRIDIGGDLSAYNGSVIQIEAGSQISVGGNYWQDETSELAISMSTDSIGMTNLVVASNAYFAANTTITVHDDGTATNEFEQVAVSSEGLFVVGSTTNNLTTELLNDTNTIQFVNHLLDIGGTVTNDNIVLKTVRLSIAEGAGLEGTSLEPVADEIDDMALGRDSNALNMRSILGTTSNPNKAMNDYYDEKTSSTPMHNVVNQGIGSIASELAVRGDNTRARMEAAAAAPAGAAGPHTEDQELQGWIAGYGTWGSRSSADGFGGYDADLAGFIIGADLAVSKNILVGLSGGSNSGSVDKNNGASGDTRTTYGAVYASIGTKAWFLDGSVIYGSSSIDSTLGDVFDTTASYDAQNIAFYLGGGKEFTGQYLIITPQASLLVNYYEQDAYDEKSTVVGRSVDSFDALYVQSSVGCNLGMYMTMGYVTLKPELRAHWLHEFNNSEETQPYQLIGGDGSTYNMLLQAPEEDILKLGAGLAAKMSEFLELRADIDIRMGSSYSDYTLFGSLRYQF